MTTFIVTLITIIVSVVNACRRPKDNNIGNILSSNIISYTEIKKLATTIVLDCIGVLVVS